MLPRGPAGVSAARRGLEVEVEHGGQRCGVSQQACAKRGALPAIDEQFRHATRVGARRQVAPLAGVRKASADTLRNLREALLHLAAKDLAHARQLLPEPAEQTAEITLLPILLGRGLEECAHARERR